VAVYLIDEPLSVHYQVVDENDAVFISETIEWTSTGILEYNVSSGDGFSTIWPIEFEMIAAGAA
jgi:hypothetical protein